MFKKMLSGFSNKDWFLLALVILTWGANATAVKVGTNEISPYTLVFIRGFLTSLIFLPFIKKISKSDFINLSIVGLTFFALHYSVMYMAIDAINSNSFVVLVMLAMPISIILSSLFLKEKIAKETYIGIGICFMGLIFAFGIPDIAQYPIGALLCIITAILWAIGSLLMKRTKHIHLPTFTFYTFAIATPFLGISAYIAEGDTMFHFGNINTIRLGTSIFYQVLVMGGMAAIWGYLIGHHRAEHVTPFLLLQVPVAAVTGYFLLDEAITIQFIISSLLIISGVGIIHYFRLKNST
jgi:O-acetylserine/cysteine efflux transporter